MHFDRRPFVFVLALVFAAATLFYIGLWFVAEAAPPGVELGFESTYLSFERSLEVSSVAPDSPAEWAGLKPGDRITAIDGRRLEGASFQPEAWRRKKAGDSVQLTITRRGEINPLELVGAFRQRLSATDAIASRILTLYPLPFVVVGIAVLLFRPHDRNAWLLAILFAGFTTIPGNPVDTMGPAVHGFVMGYQSILLSVTGALFYWFFAVFPTRSVIDVRAPWLKWLAAGFGLMQGIAGVADGRMSVPLPLARLLGDHAAETFPLWYSLSFIGLGLISLALNFRLTNDPDARRKMSVLFWGTIVGVTPGMLYLGIQNILRLPASALWIAAIRDVVLLSVFPLSFAYAVVRHRVLEIPVLLRRSARYLLVQRGFTILLALASLVLVVLLANTLEPALQPSVGFGPSAGVALGVVFGTTLLWGGSRLHRQVSGRIDRAFFRSAYDARVILEDLAGHAHSVTDRDELARLLERHLEKALQPSSLVIYLLGDDGRLHAKAGEPPAGLESISCDRPVLATLARHGVPIELTGTASNALVDVDATEFNPLHPDCLAPLMGRAGRLVGLLVLGARLSDEPYSREDLRLLASVAGQAATALDNIALAEEIAKQLERERRAAREMEIAADVQARLLPAAPSNLATLDCAARCIQALSVGGDCYDFLDLGEQRVGLVLADVSGKGVHAALLMANLQAYLRSLSSMTPLDLVRVLTEANRLMWASTAGKQYATVFFGVYDEQTRQLLYVNCGHNPPVWLHGTEVRRLNPTGTVIGLFDRWNGTVASIDLPPGDLVAIFSDGVTEALSGEEEFSEDRLISELTTRRNLPVDDIVAGVLASVQQFTAGAQYDDLTLLIARSR